MALKRWQLGLGALAILAAALACSSPGWSQAPSQAPTASPIPEPSEAHQKPQESRIEPIPSPVSLRATVSALRSVYVRADSNIQSGAIGALYHGDEVSITGRCSQDKGWVEIFYKGSRAWVNARYLSGERCEAEE